jgi:hypothetical protein
MDEGSQTLPRSPAGSPVSLAAIHFRTRTMVSTRRRPILLSIIIKPERRVRTTWTIILATKLATASNSPFFLRDGAHMASLFQRFAVHFAASLFPSTAAPRQRRPVGDADHDEHDSCIDALARGRSLGIVVASWRGGCATPLFCRRSNSVRSESYKMRYEKFNLSTTRCALGP